MPDQNARKGEEGDSPKETIRQRMLRFLKQWGTPIFFSFAAIALMFLFSYVDTPDATVTTVLVSAIAAFLGVALTMGVTQMQLNVQTDIEEGKREHKAAIKEKDDTISRLMKEKAEAIQNLEKKMQDAVASTRIEVSNTLREEYRRDSKIFEEKLRIYQEFLKTLYEVIKDRELTDDEQLLLQFQTSFVAMHISRAEHISSISREVKRIIEATCSKKRQSDGLILDALFAIVEAFRQDLYPVAEGDASARRAPLPFTDRDKEAIIENFSAAYGDHLADAAPKKEARMTVDVNIVSGLLPGLAETVAARQAAPEAAGEAEVAAGAPASFAPTFGPGGDLAAIHERLAAWGLDWHLDEREKNGEAADGLTLSSKKLRNAYIDLSFYDRYHLDAQSNGTREFSQPMKWELGGRISYGLWWNYLDDGWRDMEKGAFRRTFREDAAFRAWFLERLDFIQDALVQYHARINWKEALEKAFPENWSFSVWYWTTFKADYRNEALGNPQIIVESDAGGHHVRLSNQQNDEALLNRLLEALAGRKLEITLAKNETAGVYADMWLIREEDMVEKLRSVMGSIEKCAPAGQDGSLPRTS